MSDGRIIVAFPPDMCEAFRANAAAAAGRGIKQGSRGAWKALRGKIKNSGAFAQEDIDEFAIHLRILADLYLSHAMGEKNLPNFVDQCKTDLAGLDNALDNAKALKSWIASNSGKAVLPSDSNLVFELSRAIESIAIAITQYRIPTSSRNPVRISDHALVHGFAALWECYTGQPVKGNKKAYGIAKGYFCCAGYVPRKKAKDEVTELDDIGQKFDRAREFMKDREPVTPARRLTQQERQLYSYLAF